MELLEHLHRQFVYNAWANREVIASLAVAPAPPSRPRQLLAHILAAESLWFVRIRSQPQILPVWPDLSLDECVAQNTDLASMWDKYLDQLSPAALSNEVSYKNSKGEPWSSTVQDILTHVILHSAYHRGQIASLMRAAGQQPASTDFIRAAREGLITSAKVR